jgi:carbamoyl-phosphate synthase large subunit
MIGMGFSITCTDSTYEYFRDNGIACSLISKNHVIMALKDREISMVINTPTRGKLADRLGFVLRRTSMEFNVPCITSMDTLAALLSVMAAGRIEEHQIPLHEYLNARNDKEPAI